MGGNLKDKRHVSEILSRKDVRREDALSVGERCGCNLSETRTLAAAVEIEAPLRPTAVFVAWPGSRFT